MWIDLQMWQAMERPPQLQHAQNWDAAIDLTLRRFVYGSLSGAAAALLLFRSPTTRWAAVAFGAGSGLGSAYTDSSQLFRGALGKWSASSSTTPNAPPLPTPASISPSIPASIPEPKHHVEEIQEAQAWATWGLVMEREAMLLLAFTVPLFCS